LIPGDASESKSFRVLVASEEEEDKERKVIKILPNSFTKHFNLIKSSLEMSEIDLAPSKERAPKPLNKMRESYSHVEQVQGLKRRFKMFGSRNSSSKDDVDYQNSQLGLSPATEIKHLKDDNKTTEKGTEKKRKAKSSKKNKSDRKDRKSKKSKQSL